MSRPRKIHAPPQVGVLSKTLDILDMLRNTPDGAKLTEISVAVKFPKPTVFRIIRTLEIRGYVDRSNGTNYRLSSKFHGSGNRADLMGRMLDVGHPVMEHLVQKHQETVNLGVLDGGDVVVVHAIESPQALRMSSKAGNRRYTHSSGLGKVLIAWKDPKEIERIVRIKGLPRFTPNTLTTLEALTQELERVRRKGYAEDCEENELQGRCVAVPIRNTKGELLAALSVSGPVTRMGAREIRAILADLRLAAEELGNSL